MDFVTAKEKRVLDTSLTNTSRETRRRGAESAEPIVHTERHDSWDTDPANPRASPKARRVACAAVIAIISFVW
jgi:hypothetical protein